MKANECKHGVSTFEACYMCLEESRALTHTHSTTDKEKDEKKVCTCPGPCLRHANIKLF